MTYQCTRPSIWDGMDVTIAQQRITDMQNALLTLSMGKNVQIASYGQGDGSRMVTYTPASIVNLTQMLLSLKQWVARQTGQTVIYRKGMRPYG